MSQAHGETTDSFFDLILKGDLAGVKRSLKADKGLLHKPNNEGKSPLHVAASKGQTAIVTFLVGEGANVNFESFDDRGTFRRLPIHDAAKVGYADVITCLAEHEALLDVKDGQGNTALHLAAGFTQPRPPKDVVNVEAHHHQTELRFLAAVIALCEKGADLNLTNLRDDCQIVGRTALHLAIVKRHALIAMELIQRGARIDTKDENCFSLYLSAHQLGLTEVCEAFIARLDKEDQQQPPSESRFVRLCLDFVDANGATVLHPAAKNGENEWVQLLCDLGADPNSLDHERKTPLYLAASKGHSVSVKSLLEAGADPTIQIAYSEKTALDVARKKGHKQCIDLLEKWYRENPPVNKSAQTHESDATDEESTPSTPAQQESASQSRSSERVEVDASSLANVSLLYSQFIKENAEVNTAVKAIFEALQSPLNPEVREFLSLLESDMEADLSTLQTQSGKNFLHLMAECDPTGTLLKVSDKLSSSQINALLNQKTKEGKYLFHAASDHAHSLLFNFCLKMMLRPNRGGSLLRQSLHTDGCFIEWLLGLKHFPRKIPILFEIMADIYDEITVRSPRFQRTSTTITQFFPAAQSKPHALQQNQLDTAKVKEYRKRLLHRVFHQFHWPDELIEAMALLIGSCSLNEADSGPIKSNEAKLMDILLSDGTQPRPQILHLDHALIILALAYQSLENNTQKSQYPRRERCEQQYREQFLKSSSQMTQRLRALYDYLKKIDEKMALAFLSKIVNSQSLLKSALQKTLSAEGWWKVEPPELFDQTLHNICENLSGSKPKTQPIFL